MWGVSTYSPIIGPSEVHSMDDIILFSWPLGLGDPLGKWWGRKGWRAKAPLEGTTVKNRNEFWVGVDCGRSN